VLGLVLTLLLVWFVTTVVLAAGTLWFQAYIYSEPAEQMYWRAPAAGAVVTLFLVVWVFLDYRAPGRYRELQEFSPTESRPPFQRLRVVDRDGKAEMYQLHKDARGRPEYLLNGKLGGKPLPSRPYKVVAIEGDRDYPFEVVSSQIDDKGKYKLQRGESLRYYNKETGWEMAETHMGQVYVFHTGWLLGNVLLNVLHLLVWFACLWLLMRYQWAHALGLAVACWAVATLLVVPMVLNKTEAVARQRATPAAAAVQPLPGEQGTGNGK
jgi:hypothetical protein